MSDWIETTRPEAYKILRRHVIAFWCVEYADRVEEHEKVEFQVCGGSAFLWQTKLGKFLVTAHHVWAEFRDRLLLRPDSTLIFYLDGDHAFPISGIKLVSEDKDLDLAVLSGPGIDNLKLDEKSFFNQSEQSNEVIEGDLLALLGYPKVLRIPEKPYSTIGIVYMQGAAMVSQVGLRIRMAGNSPNKFRSNLVPSLKDFDMPGASGGPVFRFRPSGVEWVGIVSESGMAPHFDIVITPSRFIGIDGIIKRPPIMQ